MTEAIINCPHCNKEIKLNESLAAPLVEATRKQYEQKILAKNNEMAIREQTLQEKEKQLLHAKNAIEMEVATKVEQRLTLDRRRISEEEAKKAKQALAIDLEEKSRQVTELQETLDNREKKLAEAQKVQAELLKQKRELDDAKRELDLTVEKRVQENLNSTRQQAKKEAEDEQKLKVLEKENTITALQKQIEELKRRAEQGSQQLQGEVQELELENLLRSKFKYDLIEPVPKGEYGGDILHRVISATGQPCGIILWETKRTRNWQDSWLNKLREDQRTAKAEISVMVSHALPKGIETFDIVDGVFVTHPRAALPMAVVLRQSLLELATARQASEGQQTKTQIIYQYLTGPRFRLRVEAIVEAFSTMKEDLDKEKKAITKQWAKRQEQIDRVMNATVGMYGDLQGIAGRSIQEIAGLEMQAISSDVDTAVDPT